MVERLDRVLLNCEWMSKFSRRVEHLNKTCSDHSPLLITAQLPNTRSSSFIILNVWTNHHQFKDIVKEAWSSQVAGGPMIKFATKLKESKKHCKYGKNIYLGRLSKDSEQLKIEYYKWRFLLTLTLQR